jgi:hypothetical protein
LATYVCKDPPFAAPAFFGGRSFGRRLRDVVALRFFVDFLAMVSSSSGFLVDIGRRPVLSRAGDSRSDVALGVDHAAGARSSTRK